MMNKYASGKALYEPNEVREPNRCECGRPTEVMGRLVLKNGGAITISACETHFPEKVGSFIVFYRHFHEKESGHFSLEVQVAFSPSSSYSRLADIDSKREFFLGLMLTVPDAYPLISRWWVGDYSGPDFER